MNTCFLQKNKEGKKDKKEVAIETVEMLMGSFFNSLYQGLVILVLVLFFILGFLIST